jgi:hypothetical protein
MNEKGLYILIFIWIGLGYVMNIDFTQMWGCLAFDFVDLTRHKVAIASTSIFLFATSFLIGERKMKFLIAILELINWFTLVLILKGGYAVGMGGGFTTPYVMYDFVGLLLRIWLISKLVDLEALVVSSRVRILTVLLITIVAMIIKIEFFCIPLIEFY